MTAYAPSLPFDDARHLAAHRFLVEEAAILDAGDWARWLTLLTDDVRYVMPVRVTTVADAGFDGRPDMAHFDEDRYAIEKRVQRLLTDHAWTEDPPSRTRHLVTNVRTFPGDDGDGRRRVDACCCSAAAPTTAHRSGSAPTGATCCAPAPTACCASPTGTSRSRRRCCAPRTWRSSCERAAPSTWPTSSPPSPCSVVETGNGVRLRIESPRLGRAIDLDPLELETLTWQSHDLFTGLLADPYGPDEAP